jgi:cytochrome c biogenesis DsbD-like protein
MRTFGVPLSLLLFLATVCHADDLLDQPGRPKYVTLEPVQTITIVPGRPSTVQLHFRVGGGYHINSNKPSSELLIPTTVRLMPPSDIMAGRITYPPGKNVSFPFAPEEKLNVYSEEFTVKALVSATKAALPGKFTVHGEIRYQACNDNACFPPKTVPLQFNVRVGKAPPQTSTSHSVPRGQSPHIHR